MFDNINFGIAVTVIGIILVLLVLIALNYLVKINRALDEKQEGAGRPETRGQKPQQSAVQASGDTDEELVAVITAAVAAALGRSTSQIVVRSIRSLNSAAPSWAVAGRQDQINSRF